MSADIKPKTNYLPQAILNKARGDKFALILGIPQVLKNIDRKYPLDKPNRYIALDRLQFSIVGINVPNISIPKIDVPGMGAVPNVTSFVRPSYGEVSCKFVVDSEFINYFVIWKWLNFLNDTTTGATEHSSKNLQFLPNYSADISLFILNEYNEHVVEFAYRSAYPTSLEGMDFNYQKPEEILCGFTFAFNLLDVTLS